MNVNVDTVERKCEVCGDTKSILMCSGCRLVGYCSVDHQKKDWPTHRKNCKPTPLFKLEENPAQIPGKQIIATKDIPVGGIILEEPPLFFYSPTTPVTKVGQCVTCGIGLRKLDSEEKDLDNAPHNCSKCSWPVCSNKCEKASMHAENECKIFVATQADYSKENEMLGEFVMVNRGYGIQCQQPQLWNEILTLIPLSMAELDDFKDSNSEIRDTLLSGKVCRNVSECQESKFPHFAIDKEDRVREEIRSQITIIARKVGFPITRDQNVNMHTARLFLYNTATHFENSCLPNTVWSIGDSNWKIRLRASTPIKKGDVLTVQRHDHLYLGTLPRQQLFYERFRKICLCALCSDPTELGTYQSGIACSSCRAKMKESESKDEKNVEGFRIKKKMGYYLPVDPSDLSETAKWKCYICKDVQPSSQLLSPINDIHRSIQEAEIEMRRERSNTKRQDVVQSMEKMFGDAMAKFLHPNHWIVQYAVGVYQGYCSKFPDWDEKETGSKTKRNEFEECIKRLTFLLNILDKTSPGISHERARVLLLLGEGLLNLSRDHLAFVTTYDSLSKQDASKLEVKLGKSVKYLEEGMLYWKGMSGENEEILAGMAEYVKGKLSNAKSLWKLVKEHLNGPQSLHKAKEEED